MSALFSVRHSQKVLVIIEVFSHRLIEIFNLGVHFCLSFCGLQKKKKIEITNNCILFKFEKDSRRVFRAVLVDE